MKGFLARKEDFIIKQCRLPALRVLHVGCTNSPNHISRWESNSLLHEKLVTTVEAYGGTCVGIDIDSEAIQFLKQKMPNADLRVMDAHYMEKYLEPEFDLVIAGDVIEHLSNPGFFVQACCNVMTDSGQLLISTANAFGIIRFFKAILFHEAVHNEHTAYYSHKTLKRLLTMSGGLKIIDAGYYRSEPWYQYSLSLNRAISNSLERVMCQFWPNFAEGIILLAERREFVRSVPVR